MGRLLDAEHTLRLKCVRQLSTKLSTQFTLQPISKLDYTDVKAVSKPLHREPKGQDGTYTSTILKLSNCFGTHHQAFSVPPKDHAFDFMYASQILSCAVIATALLSFHLKAGAATASAAAAAATSWYVPPRTINWQYQLSDSGSITYIPGVTLYLFDIDTARTQLKAIKAQAPDIQVVCYFSAGSFEKYRIDDDANRGAYSITYPSDWTGTLGKPLDGWPGERWLDIRSPKVRSIMRRRMEFARSIGCDGVDPDNVDGYSNNSGFPLTAADQTAFNTWLAETAHSLGLGVGLKNAIELLPALHDSFDWFVNESCFTYRECDAYDVVGTIKAVLGVEYCNAATAFGDPTQDPACYCPRALAKQWDFLIKKADLGAPRVSCADYCAQTVCQPANSTKSCKAKSPDVCATAGLK